MQRSSVGPFHGPEDGEALHLEELGGPDTSLSASKIVVRIKRVGAQEVLQVRLVLHCRQDNGGRVVELQRVAATPPAATHRSRDVHAILDGRLRRRGRRIR